MIDKIHGSNPKSWHKHIRNIIGDKRSCSYLSHVNEIADTPENAADIINNHFSNINKLLPPLQTTELPAYLPSRPLQAIVNEYEVYQHLKRIPQSKSPGPDDIPPRLMREFAPELATPLCNIFNSSITEGVVPNQWKRAMTVPIPKTNPPTSLDDLRPISLTPIPSKILERIIAKELWKFFSSKLDRHQFGNISGSSTVHYLVDLINYVTSNVDSRLEVTTATIDLRKAFDLIDHTILIKKMISLGFHEGWVKWISSFIDLRSQKTRANNEISEEVELHCGVPQGTVLGPLLFLIMVNEDNIPHAKIYKHVDDMTLALAHKPGEGNTILQNSLNYVSEWTSANKMQINTKKCMEIKFKFNKLVDRETTLKIDNDSLSRVSEVNLLGVIISEDMKWFANTRKIISKCGKKFYMLIKLKAFGASREDLLRIWTSFIRPISEYAAPLWHSSITNFEIIKLERLQKRALRIILGSNYTTYTDVLNQLNIPSLQDRRETLTRMFANNIVTSERHRDLFPDHRQFNKNLRKDVNVKICEPKCNRNRYYMSTVPYCIRLLNTNLVK